MIGESHLLWSRVKQLLHLPIYLIYNNEVIQLWKVAWEPQKKDTKWKCKILSKMNSCKERHPSPASDLEPKTYQLKHINCRVHI